METNYEWFNNVRRIKGLGFGPAFELQYFYKYYVNTDSLSSIGHYEYQPFAKVLRKDSLFLYDVKGRIVGSEVFGIAIRDGSGNVTLDYTTFYPENLFDTTVYFDNNNSYQRYYYGRCNGRKFYEDGRSFYDFQGDISPVANLCGRHGEPDSRGYNSVNHYKSDIDGNILARDSAYIDLVFPGGMFDYNGHLDIAFDTIAYYGFKNTDEVTSINDQYEELTDNTQWQLFPNPAQGNFYIHNSRPGILSIYTLEGTRLSQYKLKGQRRKQNLLTCLIILKGFIS